MGLARALWLAPNARTAESVRAELVAEEFKACLQPGIFTFDQLGARISAEATPRQLRLTKVQQRNLLRRIVQSALRQGRLATFLTAARRDAFVDLLIEHIRELVRLDVSPSDYAKAVPPRGDEKRHAELVHFYAEYIREHTAHGLVDTDTIHWATRDALAAGAGPQEFEIVVVDGFTDFTRTQHDILRLLAKRAKHMLVSLPLEQADERGPAADRGTAQARSGDAGARPDLFAKVTHTLTELRRRHPRFEIRRFQPDAISWPAIEYLTENIFRHPRNIDPPAKDVLETLDRVEIVESAGAQDEIVAIARRIKQQLAAGPAVRPGEIVVVFRSLREAASRVRDVFRRFGIPYFLESEARFVSVPVVRTVRALVGLAGDDWPFRRVVSVLTNNSLTALDETARTAAEWLVRDLQIAQGRDRLLDRVDQLAAEPTNDGHDDHLARRARKARAAKPALAKLAEALDRLPGQGTLTEWAAAIRALGTELGLGPFGCLTDKSVQPIDAAVRTEDDLPQDETVDIVAWQVVERHLADLQRLDSLLDQPPRQWSLKEFAGVLQDVVTKEALPRAHDEVGRVLVLSAPGARNVTARHLYLAGMSEQAFPSPTASGRLAGEAEYRFAARVADQEVAATRADFATRAQEEMLLFYEVLSRAEETLTISYPALDERAQKLPASPYVLEIERVLGETGRGRIQRTMPDLSPVPNVSPARGGNFPAEPRANRPLCSLSDWRIQAVADALADDCSLLAGLATDEMSKASAAAIEGGLGIVHARARGESYGPAEGILASPAVAERLAKCFGPQHLWSPSQWETYASCPYKFFLQVVLGLEPLGELVLETDYARRGSRLHHVLATFHRRWPAVRGSRSLTPEEEAAEYLEHLHQVIEERVAASPRGGIDAALAELDCRQIRKWVANHFQHEARYASAFSHFGSPLMPRHFEFRFGPARGRDADSDPDSTGDAFVLDIEGEQVLITGQIDRIDVVTSGGQNYFNVIDYKSSKKASLKPEHIESGERLQLPIYVEAAQALIFNGEAAPLAAGYWSMSGGFDAKGALADARQDFDGERWKSMRLTVRRLVRQFLDGIRRGEFPVASRDDKCTSYCEFSTVCRVSQIRNLNKTWPPPGQTP